MHLRRQRSYFITDEQLSFRRLGQKSRRNSTTVFYHMYLFDSYSHYTIMTDYKRAMAIIHNYLILERLSGKNVEDINQKE
jgi:hypothetical protein